MQNPFPLLATTISILLVGNVDQELALCSPGSNVLLGLDNIFSRKLVHLVNLKLLPFCQYFCILDLDKHTHLETSLLDNIGQLCGVLSELFRGSDDGPDGRSGDLEGFGGKFKWSKGRNGTLLQQHHVSLSPSFNQRKDLAHRSVTKSNNGALSSDDLEILFPGVLADTIINTVDTTVCHFQDLLDIVL